MSEPHTPKGFYHRELRGPDTTPLALAFGSDIVPQGVALGFEMLPRWGNDDRAGATSRLRKPSTSCCATTRHDKHWLNSIGSGLAELFIA
jgi:hypothetical protein